MAWDWRADLEINSRKKGVIGAIKAFFLDPSFTFVVWVRLFMWLKSRKFPLSGMFASLVFAHMVKTFSCEVTFQVKSIGKALHIPHAVGIVIGGEAEIGENVTIHQNVTIGIKNRNGDARIQIGNNVIVSSGAVVLSPIQIGDNAIVGANAVVIKDVLENTAVVGIPARPISLRS